MSGPPAFESPDDGAAFWDARLRAPSCTAQDRLDFAAWRQADPAHAEAHDRLQQALRALHGAYAATPELRAFRDAALRSRPPYQPLIAAGLAVAVLLGGGMIAWRGLGPGRPETTLAAVSAGSIYQTAHGERSVVQLSDGSKVTLNTQSRLEVSFTPERRSVRLISGQGLFEVAKNPNRPFVVTAGVRTVTAVGTAFDVRLDPAQLTVTMVEGRVRVARTIHPAGRDEQSLVAGQRLTAPGRGPIRLTTVDPREATSWSEGRVVFDDTPLADALAEINRYSSVRFTLADAALGQVRINGMFRTEQPMSFVRALASYLPIELHSTANGVMLAARPGAPG